MACRLMLVAVLLCGCNSQPSSPNKQTPVVKPSAGADWETLPTGFEIVHTPNPVAKPIGPIQGRWPYKWTFRTEIRAKDQPLKVTQFMILAWDGQNWILDKKQQNYNSGEGDTKLFAKWYGCAEGKIGPGKPAVDEKNWAGNSTKSPFKQKWVVIGEDAMGQKYKGDGVVELIID